MAGVIGRFATFWQYADSGPNPGDQDEFNGSLQGLKKYVVSPCSSGLGVRDTDHDSPPVASLWVERLDERNNGSLTKPTMVQCLNCIILV